MKAYGWGIVDNTGDSLASVYLYEEVASDLVAQWNVDKSDRQAPWRVVELFYKEEGVE